MNEIRYYFGAYLTITVRKIERTQRAMTCENGHNFTTKFCPHCGLPLIEKEFVEYAYPRWLSEIDENYDEALAEITPGSLLGSGVIIAKNNFYIDDGEEWIDLDRDEIKPFPSEYQIKMMVDSLKRNLEEQIERLKKNPAVVFVNIDCGYVMDADY